MQSRDEALKDPLLSPIPEDLPDIFGTIPIDKIKGEPYMQDENLIDFPNIEIMSENHAIEHKSPTTNKEMTNTQSDLQLRQIDKNLNESNKLLLNNICIEQDLSQSNSENSNETMASPDLNVNSIKREPINEELSYQSAASSGHEMPVLSPELDVVQPKLEEYTSVNPPFLEISGHE